MPGPGRPCARRGRGGTGGGGLPSVALAFDGSYYYYFNILQEQRPFTPNSRYSAALLQWPLIAASHLTTDTEVLRDVFSLTYACPAVIALMLSWLVVRRDRPELFLWPVLGICLLILPSSLFQVSEALTVAQLVWPVVLATVLGLRSRAQIAIAVGVAVVMLGLHPLSSVLLGATGVLAAVTAWRDASAVDSC